MDFLRTVSGITSEKLNPWMQAQFFEYWWKSVLCSCSLPGTEGSGISQWLLLLVAEQFSAQPSLLFTSSVNCQCSLRFLCLLVHEGTHCVSVMSVLKGIQWCIKCCLPCSSRTVFTYKPVVCFHWQKDKAYRNKFDWSHLCLDGPWGWRNLSPAATSPAGGSRGPPVQLFFLWASSGNLVLSECDLAPSLRMRWSLYFWTFLGPGIPRWSWHVKCL